MPLMWLEDTSAYLTYKRKLDLTLHLLIQLFGTIWKKERMKVWSGQEDKSEKSLDSDGE